MESWFLMGRFPPSGPGKTNTFSDLSVHSDEPTWPWVGGANAHSEQLGINTHLTNNFRKTPRKGI